MNVLLLYKSLKFIPCLFVSQTFSPHSNFIWRISIIKWKNSGVQVTCKGKALCDKQHHGGVDTKSAVSTLLFMHCVCGFNRQQKQHMPRLPGRKTCPKQVLKFFTFSTCIFSYLLAPRQTLDMVICLLIF